MIISKGIGIDLGTTNSAAAVMNPTDTDVHLYTDRQSRNTVPSCVWRKRAGGPIVAGHEAYVRRGGRPEPIVSIKRKMGTSLVTPLGAASDVPEDVPAPLRERLLAHQAQRQAEFLESLGDGLARSRAAAEPDLLWLPEEISACIVDDMRRRISETLKGMAADEETYVAERGIITVPAYFDMTQIEATREAGRLAGLEVIDLLHEPTAAAVYYSWRHSIPDGVFMVFDLGGGTFDVSVLRRTRGEFEVLGISGDNFLGGDDFDRLLAEWIRARLSEDDYDLDLDVDKDPEDAIRFRRLTALAESVKKELSDGESHVLRDQSALRDKSGEQVFVEMEIRRSVFEDLIRDVVWGTLPKCWEGLARAYRRSGVTLQDVDHILLVGGSTNIPLVQRMVRDHFCVASGDGGADPRDAERILASVDDEVREIARKLMDKNERAKCGEAVLDSPGTCVAMGAAIRAAAAGLFAYDDRRETRVFFRGQGGTDKDNCDLMGFVQSGDGSRPLTDVTIRLTGPDATVLDEQMTDENGHFRFRSVGLAGDAVTTFGFSILDEDGNVVAEMGRRVARTEDHRDIGSVLSTAVLSKPVLLEIAHQDRLTRGILLEEGCSLPATGAFRFFLRDQSGLMRLPLYQGNRPIRELTVSMDRQLESGTPVDLKIHCDEQMYIRLEVEVGAQEFDVDVGPPPPPSPPNGHEILELMSDFRSRLGALDAEEQTSFEQRCQGLLDDLNKAMAAGDNAKAISKYADLQGLLKSMDLRTPKLEPPWNAVERLYAEILDLAGMAQLLLPSFDGESGRDRLNQYREEAQAALMSGDQQLYGEAIDKIRSFGDALKKQLAENMQRQRQADIPENQRARLSLTDLCRRVDLMRLMAIGTGRTDLDGPLRAIKDGAVEMETRAPSEPHEVLRWCQEKRNELNRYQSQLGGDDQGETKLKDGLLGLSASFGSGKYDPDKGGGEIRGAK